MRFLKLDQDKDQEQWLNWRKGKLSASISAPIMGVYTYDTPLMLYERIHGLNFPTPPTEDMIRGKSLEDEARQKFNDMMGFNFEALCCELIEHPYLIASLDGISNDRNALLEIKCPNPMYDNHLVKAFDNLKEKKPVYFHQTQWQMMVSNADYCYFLVYWRDELSWTVVYRDDEYIETCKKKAIKWYQKHVVEMIEPKKIKVVGEKYNQGDFITITEPQAIEIAQKLAEIKKQRNELAKADKPLKEAENEYKNALVNLSDDLDFYCDQVKLTRISRRKVDTEKLYADFGITEEVLKKYTSNDIGFWRVSLEN